MDATPRTTLRARALLALIALFAALLIAVTGSESVAAPGAAEPVTKAELLASEKVFPSRARSNAFGVGRLALTRLAYARMWRKFNLRGDRPDVSLRRRAVLFAASGESGSCPMTYAGFAVHPGRGVLRIEIEDLGDAICTSDWTPRTMVVSVPRARVPAGKLRTRFGSNRPFRVNRVRL